MICNAGSSLMAITQSTHFSERCAKIQCFISLRRPMIPSVIQTMLQSVPFMPNISKLCQLLAIASVTPFGFLSLWKIIKESLLVCSTKISSMANIIIQCLCRYRSEVARGIGVIPTSTNEAYGKLVRVTGGGGIPTSTNEAYGKVGGGEREEGYEMVKISHREPPPPPAKLEEIPLSPAPPSQSLPTIPLPPTAGAEENTAVYEVISGDQ